jgi:hypothetical protein
MGSDVANWLLLVALFRSYIVVDYSIQHVVCEVLKYFMTQRALWHLADQLITE